MLKCLTVKSISESHDCTGGVCYLIEGENPIAAPLYGNFVVFLEEKEE